MSLGIVGAGAAAETETTRFEGSDTFADYVPCVSEFPSLEGFEITIEFEGVSHSTETENGHRFSERVSGTFSAVPVLLADEDENGEPDFDEATGSFVIAGPRDGESFTGTFADSGSGNFNKDDHTVTLRHTFKVRGIGDEGTDVNHHENAHITSLGGCPCDPSAIVRVDFIKAKCH
ncbi:MAG: hypothetical protein ACREV8_11210 [Gammaproteobacteria bacterium]